MAAYYNTQTRTNQYKGYSFTFYAEPGKGNVKVKLEKNGRSLEFGSDSNNLNEIMSKLHTIVDFIEYQVERSTQAVMEAIKDQDWSVHKYNPEKDNVDDYDEDLNELTQLETEKETKSGGLDSWFDTVDTSRYLEDK